ncbi:MAG: lectin-like protein, partial [Flavobacteriales bacterium]
MNVNSILTKTKVCLYLIGAMVYLFLASADLTAQSVGPRNPATSGNDTSVGTQAWSNQNNNQSSNDNYATGNFTATSNYLTATNFSMAVPPCALVTGIEVSIEKSTAAKPAIGILNGWTSNGSHTSGAGNNRVLVVTVSIENANADRNVSSITYGGQNMTKIVERVAGPVGTFYNRTEIWYLNDAGITAASGSAINVTYGGGAASSFNARVGAVTLNNVDQVNPIISTASNSSTGGTVNFGATGLAVGVGDFILTSATMGANGSYAINSGFTEGFDQVNATTMTSQGATKVIATAATENPTVTFTGTANQQVLAAVAFNNVDFVDTSVRLTMGGSFVGNNKASSTEWGTTDAATVYGGPGDMWGLGTVLGSDVNASTFGVGISARGGNALSRVDHITMRIYYTNESIPPTITCPANITVAETAGLCGAVVNYNVDVADNCSSCAPASIPGYTLIGTYNGHTYFRSNTNSTWPVANTSAQSLGAHLVTISSAGENSFLSGIGQHWSGLTDEAVEGTWVWVTGEPVIYTSWAGGEPNNSGNQDYMLINWSGTNWDDQGASSLPFVVEFDCVTANLVTGLPSGSVFPVGTTTVTYNAADQAGNLS